MSATVRNLKIGIIGLGMVGDPIRRWFEEKRGLKRGSSLFCYDSDPAKGYFDDYNKADVIFISVPTPPNPDGSCNVSIVESVVGSIRDEKIIVIKSTVAVGTTEGLQARFPQHKFLFNPEFLTEAQAWEDFLKPVRQIVGYTKQSKDVAMTVMGLLPMAYYQSPWLASTYTMRIHTATEAEVIKYASNVFGAIKVTFANSLYDVCAGLKDLGLAVDYENIRDALGADPRVGPAWLDVEHGSYRGFGGYCFPKDLRAFMKSITALKNKTHPRFVGALNDVLNFFHSVWNYNTGLLEAQNLTVEDVSRHDKEIILAKRKKI